MESLLHPTATALLREGHRKVESLLGKYASAQSSGDRVGLLEDLCRELEIHGRLEERYLFPALATARGQESPLRALGRDQLEIRRLVSEIRMADGSEGLPLPGKEALLPRLMGCVEQHVRVVEAEALRVLEGDEARDGALGQEMVLLKLKLNTCPPIHESIDLEVPVGVAYNQWTQFESFPRILESVREVRQIDDTHVQWCVRIGDREVRWTAEIYEQVPDLRIAWTSVDGAVNAGSATFRPLGARAARMLLELAYEPQGLLEDLGAMLGVVSRRVRAELTRFKAYVESAIYAFRVDILANRQRP